VRIRLAISTLLIFSFFIVFSNCQATISLSAVARVSSKMLSSLRKSSSDEPIFGFFSHFVTPAPALCRSQFYRIERESRARALVSFPRTQCITNGTSLIRNLRLPESFSMRT
jgi:hypothetical protein